MTTEPSEVPAFIVERNARWKRQREERDARLRAQGYRLISCLAVRDVRNGTRLLSTWVGETERFLLVDPPPNYLEYGIGCVLIGPDSRLVAIALQDGSAKDGPVLTVFKGTVPR